MPIWHNCLIWNYSVDILNKHGYKLRHDRPVTSNREAVFMDCILTMHHTFHRVQSTIVITLVPLWISTTEAIVLRVTTPQSVDRWGLTLHVSQLSPWSTEQTCWRESTAWSWLSLSAQLFKRQSVVAFHSAWNNAHDPETIKTLKQCTWLWRIDK